MMNTQPTALRLADALDYKWFRWGADEVDERKAAAELRRLHAVNEELLGALKLSVTTMRGLGVDELDGAFLQARAAIAKATGEQA